MELIEWKQRLDQVFSLPTEEEQYNSFRLLVLLNQDDVFTSKQIGRDIREYIVIEKKWGGLVHNFMRFAGGNCATIQSHH